MRPCEQQRECACIRTRWQGKLLCFFSKFLLPLFCKLKSFGGGGFSGFGPRSAPPHHCVCSSQGSGVLLVQSQRRKQTTKNPVDSPGAGEGVPSLSTREERRPRSAAAPDAHTHTLAHAREAQHARTCLLQVHTQRKRDTSILRAVFVHQPLAPSSWFAQRFGGRRGARHTPPSLAVSFIRTRQARLGRSAPPSKSKENNTSEQQKKHQQCYACHCARDSACAQSVLACPMQAYSSVARTSRRGSTSWCTNRVRRLPRRRHER